MQRSIYDSNPNSSTILDGKSLHLAPKTGCDSPMGHSLTLFWSIKPLVLFCPMYKIRSEKTSAFWKTHEFLAERRHVAAPSRFCSYEICYGELKMPSWKSRHFEGNAAHVEESHLHQDKDW